MSFLRKVTMTIACILITLLLIGSNAPLILADDELPTPLTNDE